MKFCACSCANMRISCRCLYAAAGTTVPEERRAQRPGFLCEARMEGEQEKAARREALFFKRKKRKKRRFQGSSTRSLSLQQEECIELWLVVMINLVPSEMQDFAQQEATRGKMNKRGKMRKQKRVQVPKETQKRPKARGER